MHYQPIFKPIGMLLTHRSSPPELTTTRRAANLAWNIFSVACFPVGIARLVGHGIGRVAKMAILPSAVKLNTMMEADANIEFMNHWALRDSWRSLYDLKEFTVETPDHAQLKAYYFQYRGADNHTPTTLLFNPNAAICAQEPYAYLMQECARRHRPCNFVQFDYRGVNGSQGSAKSAQDLVLDGESMIQFIREHLNVPPHLLRIYGWSLGAAVAANAAVLHPECTGPIVCDRTFSSIANVARAHFSSRLLSWLPGAIRSQNWDLSVEEAAVRLKDRLLVIYHPLDSVIPEKASLSQAVRSSLPIDHIIELPGEKGINHHCQSLSQYFVSQKRADQIAIDFILGKSAIDGLDNAAGRSDAQHLKGLLEHAH